MNKLFFGFVPIFLLVGFMAAKAQTVSIYKIDALLKRIYNNHDSIYVVNFWATWCKPCVDELPEFEKFNKVHSGQAVKVILVSLDFAENLRTKLIPFLEKHPCSSEVILLDELNGNDFIEKIHKQWSGAIPATLITSKGKHKQVFLEKKITVEILEEELTK